MERYLIERGCFVTPCKFNNKEQLNFFLQSGQKDCEDTNERIKEEENESYGITGVELPRYIFEYRDKFDKTEDDLKIEELVKHGVIPRPIVTKIYPESVLEDLANVPPGFIDKQANWNNRRRRKFSEEAEMDVKRIQRYLDQAEQIRKNLRGTTNSNSKQRVKKPNTVADKLERLIERNPEKMELSAERLADKLKCSATAIKTTPTWENIRVCA